MHYLAFDKSWFEKHQRTLIWLLQFRTFRRILRIDSDLPIVQIFPNAYTVYLGRDKNRVLLQTDFRTHWKYSKRLYHAFKSLWWAMHVWDLFADLVIPTLSFGFDTLTSNPVAGSSSPVDGIVKQNYSAGSGVSWATIIADAGNGFDNACATWGFGHDTVFFIKGDNVSNKWIQLERSIFCFDTSALTASAVISAATLSLFGNDKADGLGSTPNANIYGATPASTSTLANGDYTQVGSTAFSTAISYSSLSTTAYNDFVLNASGLANISLTGISKFGGRNANYDVAAITPTWVSNQFSYFICSHADRTGTNEDPKLLVTYSLPAPPASVESVASVAFQIKDQVTAY